MSELTKNLKLHKWIIPDDNNENFDYKKSIADAYDIIDEFAEETDTRLNELETDNITNKENIESIQDEQSIQNTNIEDLKKKVKDQEELIPTRNCAR